ncbi:MAG: DUF116 domain-containing protein [Chloroflexi bacterium]|nr:MAG: DUF116 domain-containing protein [Chloroflexota bacterium]
MTGCRPYCLKSREGSSDEYYRVIAGFAGRWLDSVRGPLTKPVAHFQTYLSWQASQPGTDKSAIYQRSFAEVAFELLALGVLLREHGGQALQFPQATAWVLTRLVETQDRLPLPVVEKPVKAARGLVQGLAGDAQRPDRFRGPVDELPFNAGAARVVLRLVRWLEAKGMPAQASRLEQWSEYLAGLDAQQAEAILARCLLLAEDFAADSQVVLGGYTQEVSQFITCAQSDARWRYDSGLVTRTQVEYHLGMLGTEILSRAYRARFQAAPRKLVVVPDCLCARSVRVTSAAGESCQAERTGLGGRCLGCTPACRVNGLAHLGEKHGFEVYILPDDMRGIGLSSCSQLQGVGVVGVSCALTNWDAGWQVTAGGIPAQGVLLDYAGCNSHWSEQGDTTDVNARKLLEVLGKEDLQPAQEAL